MTDSLKLAARAGDTKAIEALMNKAFASKGVTVRVTNAGSLLKILLRDAHIPKEQLSEALKRGLLSIKPKGFDKVAIKAEAAKDQPAWTDQWALVETIEEPTQEENAVAIKDGPRWYQQTWLVILLIIVLPIVGIPLIWTSRWSRKIKMRASIVTAGWLLFALAYNLGAAEQKVLVAESATEVEAKEKQDEVPESLPEGASQDASETSSQPEKTTSPHFDEAVRTAILASEATQTAETAQQWGEVADPYW